MPEAYWHAEEVKSEVRRLHPEWLRPKPNLELFRRVKYDWIRTKGGVWDAIARQAELLQQHRSGTLEHAREQACCARNESRDWNVSWESANLTKSIGMPTTETAGWNGKPVEAWRLDASTVFEAAIQTVGHPARDWLAGEIDLRLILMQPGELTRFWLHEVATFSMPRHWLRWAFAFLQRFRRVTDGTPVDVQLSSYMVDADLFVSADKNLVWVVSRCKSDAPFKLAEPLKVPGGEKAVDEVVRLLHSGCRRSTFPARGKVRENTLGSGEASTPGNQNPPVLHPREEPRGGPR